MTDLVDLITEQEWGEKIRAHDIAPHGYKQPRERELRAFVRTLLETETQYDVRAAQKQRRAA